MNVLILSLDETGSSRQIVIWPGFRLALSFFLLALLSGVATDRAFAQASSSADRRYESREVAVSYSPESYAEGRKAFLAAAQWADARLFSYRNPEEAPDATELFTDVAVLGPEDASSILVLGSGTHGVEGFSGSGVQTGLLREGIVGRLPEDAGLVMIHALNPYGFAWRRRANEDNIDLNRNFAAFHLPLPANREYDLLAAAIAPNSCSPDSMASAKNELVAYLNEHGLPQLQGAITQGQFNHPTGVHYGGTSPSWSRETLERIVKEHLGSASQVVLIDFHTGLGEFGHGECILNEPAESAAYARAREWWGDRAHTTVEGRSVSAHIQGSLKYGFARMFPEGTVVTATSLEFGTYEPLEVFFATQAENCIHHNADPLDPSAEAAKESMLRAFYPDSTEWKERIWLEANDVVYEAFDGLAGQRPPPLAEREERRSRLNMSR